MTVIVSVVQNPINIDSQIIRVSLSNTGIQGGGVQSVSGLNTDNTDPKNPIIQISVDGDTITGSGTPEDPLIAIGGGGGLSYQGAWNASTNSPTLTSSVGTNGYYYVVSVAGSTNLNGITDWAIGDWAIFNGTAWQKIDNSENPTAWGSITGTLSAQTDLQAALDAKANHTANTFTDTQTIQKDGGAARADGLVLENPTAATSGNQKWSPVFRLRGRGWKTNATAGSQTVDLVGYMQPIQGTSAPTGQFVLGTQINNGTFITRLTISSDGAWGLSNATMTGIASLTATSLSSASINATQNINASQSSGAFIKNVSNIEIARFGVFNSNWEFSSNCDVYFNRSTANSIMLLDGSKKVSSNQYFNFSPSTNRHGVGVLEADTEAVIDCAAVLGEGVGAPSGVTLARHEAVDLPTPSSNYTVTQVTTFDNPSSASAGYTLTGSGYINDTTTWTFDYYFADSTGNICQYTPANASVTGTDGMEETTIGHSWGDISVGDFNPTSIWINRTNDSQWVNIGVTGSGAGSWDDDNTAWINTGPNSRNDLTASGASQDYDAYATGTSPSGNAYYSPGFETFSFSDDSSGNYYVRRHASNAGTLKFSNGTNSGTTPYDENADGLSGDLTFTPASYGFTPNTDNFQASVYNRATLFGQLTYSSGANSSSQNDEFTPYYWDLTYSGNGNVKVRWDNGDGTLGNVAELSGNSISFDGLSPTGGDTTVTPTQAIPAAFRVARDTASMSELPVAIVKSLNASTPAPYIDFQNSSDSSLGKMGVVNNKWQFQGTTKRNVTGSRGSNAALASLLTQLADLGLITDSTT